MSNYTPKFYMNVVTYPFPKLNNALVSVDITNSNVDFSLYHINKFYYKNVFN